MTSEKETKRIIEGMMKENQTILGTNNNTDELVSELTKSTMKKMVEAENGGTD